MENTRSQFPGTPNLDQFEKKFNPQINLRNCHFLTFFAHFKLQNIVINK